MALALVALFVPLLTVVTLPTLLAHLFRQILRHRSFSFQEFSQRYANPVKDLEFKIREARLQDDKNRQNSVETENEEIISKWNELQEEVIETSKNAYNWAIEAGIAKEQARSVLPEGNTVSRLYMNGTKRQMRSV